MYNSDPDPNSPAALADGYDAVLLDLDGTLFRGSEPIPAAPPTIAALRARGTRIVFITNNSSAPPLDVVRKLATVGIEASADEIVTSAGVTADLLSERAVRSAFVIGENGIRDALADRGISVLDDPHEVDAVVVGFDRSATYETLRRASILVDHGALLVATNRDASFPAPGGERWPGAGALLAAIETATGAEAEVVGKPAAPLFEAARQRAGGTKPLVVGDRLDTDIAGAAALGWDSLFVLSGVNGRDDVRTSGIEPTFVADDVGALLVERHRLAAG